jgi:glycosyltransferase involved in cell wall biosynthesis
MNTRGVISCDLRIAVSCRFAPVTSPTGTQRSARAFIAAIANAPRIRVVSCVRPGSLIRAGTLQLSKSQAATRCLDHLWEQLSFPLTREATTLLTLMGTGPVFHPGKRHVMVVHDLNYELLPRVFGKAFRLWYRFACGAAAQRADVVVCFTDYVNATIQARLSIPADRIRVIRQGPGLNGLDKPLESPLPQTPVRPYFLCVGSLQPHKNLAGVLAAWEMFSQRHGGYSLKVVGRPQGNFASLGLDLAKLPQDVEFSGYLSDEELIGLYRGATGFLYPSIEEGFGLPVVESFYCGCPVVTSNRSCLPEVAGGAALLVNPNNAAAIAEAMTFLVQNPRKAQELISKGFERAKYFTWENAGLQMASILEEACR